jgi:cyclic pyranopterin phosphate synthase
MLAGLGVDVALTTNGVKLPELAHDLAAAGLDRVNVSLDTLRRETFLALTRRDELDRVLAGIAAALDAGLLPVKVNCVVIRGINDHEVVDLAGWARDLGVGMRFIEFMPLDADDNWSIDRVVPAREILERIDDAYPLRTAAVSATGHVEPAERFEYADGLGDVGVIASVTEPFCDNCDRIRLTAEGMLRTCLFATREFDLRAVLRSGDAHDLDERLAGEIERAVGTKWAGHRIGQTDFERPARSMSQIGG